MSIRSVVAVLLSVLVLGYASSGVAAQTTAFSYQGSLADGGGMADGMYDFEFTLFDALTGGSSVGTDEHLGVQVLDGLFTVELDFGSVPFDLGNDRWLEVSVRLEGAGSYTALDPRTKLGAVPYATHAEISEVAGFALSGPFAPADTTPRSTSGVANQQFIYGLDVDGQQINNIEVHYPIVISREVFELVGFGLNLGAYEAFMIEVEASFDPNNQWALLLRNHEENVTLDIRTQAPGGNATDFQFRTGRVIGHRFETTGTRLVEVLTLSFGGELGKGISPVGDFVTRNTGGFSGGGHGPFSPGLGGSSATPGNFTYSFDGVVPVESNVGSLPGEIHPIEGFSGGILDNAVALPLTMLHNVYADFENTMWVKFSDGGFNRGRIELRDQGNVVWQPVHDPNELGVLTQWTLDMADDGGLFETYRIEYLGERVFP